VTRLGTIRLGIARTREKKFLPRALQPFQRRAKDMERNRLLSASHGKTRSQVLDLPVGPIELIALVRDGPSQSSDSALRICRVLCKQPFDSP
jgi:hypothetical protein